MPDEPDYDVFINAGSPPGAQNSIVVEIDVDNNSPGELFSIEKNEIWACNDGSVPSWNRATQA